MAEARRSTRSAGAFAELTLARVRELIREPEAVFWVFVFPIILAAILGLAFRSRPPERCRWRWSQARTPKRARGRACVRA